MKYEIINPSDKCFISSDNEKVACYCNLLLGGGAYGLKRDNGEIADGIHMFGYSEKQMNADYEGDIEKFVKTHAKEIAECFESFEYASERTSLNNIGARAERYALHFKKLQDVIKSVN